MSFHGSVNSALASRLLPRVLRDSARLAYATANTGHEAETYDSGYGRIKSATSKRFVEKWEDDTFLALFRGVKELITWSFITNRAKAELGMSYTTVGRKLAQNIQCGRIRKYVGERGAYYVLAEKPTTRAKAAAAAPTISERERSCSVQINLTAEQHREFSLWAAANNCPIDQAILVLAALRFETVCSANMGWDEELRIFNERHRIYVQKRHSVMQSNANGAPAPDDFERQSLLEIYESRSS